MLMFSLRSDWGMMASWLSMMMPSATGVRERDKKMANGRLELALSGGPSALNDRAKSL
jgi:hypothetical protein